MVIKPNVLSARGVKGLACNIVRTDYVKWKWRLQIMIDKIILTMRYFNILTKPSLDALTAA